MQNASPIYFSFRAIAGFISIGIEVMLFASETSYILRMRRPPALLYHTGFA